MYYNTTNSVFNDEFYSSLKLLGTENFPVNKLLGIKFMHDYKYILEYRNDKRQAKLSTGPQPCLSIIHQRGWLCWYALAPL